MNANLYTKFPFADSGGPPVPVLETAGGRVWNSTEIDRAAACYAQCLRGLGVHVGDRVVSLVTKSPEALFLYLACLRAGAVHTPLSPDYTAAEAIPLLRDADPALVICDPEMEIRLSDPSLSVRTLTLDGKGGGSLPEAVAGCEGDFGTAELGPDDLAAILYTSGTTGRPKGAMLTHGNLQSGAAALAEAWEVRASDTLLHVLPLHHVHGLFVAANCAFLAGARMLLLPRFDAPQVCGLLPRCTVMMGVPTHYVRLLEEAEFGVQACSGMRLFISGSAPLREEDFERFRRRTGHALLERYGLTETVINTSNPLAGERRPGSVGFPLPGVEIRVVGEHGTVLVRGETGMLEVRGPNVFKGYWQMPEATREAFREDGFFVTGDLAQIGEDGFVQIIGRAKDLVISGGLNVYPREVERMLDEIPGIDESAVVGIPHPDLGEAVVAAVAGGGAGLEEAEVIEICRRHLAGYKLPKRVFFLNRLPRNTMGKIQKAKLRQRYADLFEG